MDQLTSPRIDTRVTAIIQARMQSKRLPGKSMKELAGVPMIVHVINRARAMQGVDSVVVATCENNEALADCARANGAQVWIGSESNVLQRYYDAAREFGGDYIVRITGDNPFTDVEYGTMSIEIAVESGADLTSVSGIPLGAGVEVIKFSALETAYQQGSTPYHFEHVTPYLKEHEELFTIQRHPVRLRNTWKKLRLTVDTEEDFRLASLLYDELYKGEPFSVREVISFIEQNPDAALINQNIEQRPMTHSEKQ